MAPGYLSCVDKREETALVSREMDGRVRWERMRDMERDSESVLLTLRMSDALVIDNLLARWDELGMPPTIRLDHDAEWGALWAIEAGLETQLADLTSPHYDELIDLARAQIVERTGPLLWKRRGAMEGGPALMSRLRRKLARRSR